MLREIIHWPKYSKNRKYAAFFPWYIILYRAILFIPWYIIRFVFLLATFLAFGKRMASVMGRETKVSLR